MRKWTSTQGSTIEAELIDYSDRVVVLRSAQGRRISLRLDQLSQPDQAFVLGGKKEDSAPAAQEKAEQVLDPTGKKEDKRERSGDTLFDEMMKIEHQQWM